MLSFLDIFHAGFSNVFGIRRHRHVHYDDDDHHHHQQQQQQQQQKMRI
jgi:hypothetical protein